MAYLDTLATKDEEINNLINSQSNQQTNPQNNTSTGESQQLELDLDNPNPPQQQPPQQATQPQQSNVDYQYLQSQNDSLRMELATLKQSLNTMQQQVANANKKPEKPEFEVANTPTNIDLTEEERSMIGDATTSKALAKLITQIVDAKLIPIVTKLNDVNKSIKDQFDQVSGTLQQNTQQQFEQAVLNKVPNAREILANTSRFWQWLNTTTSHGVPLVQNFNQACADRNSDVVSNILKAYDQLQTKKSTKANLENQVEPPTNSQSQVSTKPQTFRMSEYTRAVSDMTRRKISESEFKKIEQRYHAAMQSNTVDFER